MITMILPVQPSGDVSQVDTSNILKGSVFADDVYGVMNWNGANWVGGDGTMLTPLVKSNEDLLTDENGLLYLPLPAWFVVACEINNKSYNGQLDKDFTPSRYYASFDLPIVPQIIKILAVL